MNYREYWKFDRWPFGHNDSQFHFLAVPSVVEADARMKVVLERGQRVAILVGDEGVGKTAFLRRYQTPALASQFRNYYRPLYVSMTGFSRGDLISSLAEQSIDKYSFHRSANAQRNFSDLLVANAFQNLSTLLLLDDIHLASGDCALDVLRLIEERCSPTIVLSTATMPSGPFQEIVQNYAQLRIDLPAWNLEDTECLLQKSLAASGADPLIFGDQAIVRIHELSCGIVRRIIQIAEMSLLVGAATEVARIAPDVVDKAAEEIPLPQQEPTWQ